MILQEDTKKVAKDVAIIGMSGRFPDADTLAGFTENLTNGKDSIKYVDLNRINSTNISPGISYSPYAYLNNIHEFDYDFFEILKNEAVRMAPQQRIMLMMVHELIESAGYSRESLHGSRTSLYMASNSIEYYKHAEDNDPSLITGNILSGIAGHIARYFNFIGNAVYIDTACSSSLVAFHLACQDIIHGDSEQAICGGVNLVLFPKPSMISDPSGILSNHGRSKTFSNEAQGAGSGEAATCVLLKPLSKAIEDKDNILAVVKSTAVNQDAARSSTIASPSSIAQSEMIRLAHEKAGVSSNSITYIEAHGTGTKLGDPIEVEGLKESFENDTNEKQFCALSALKSNIGHTDAAAGLAGLIKVLLSLKYKVLYPSIHVDRLNPHIDFLNSPFYVNTQMKKWESKGIRRAGVSSFGITGTNAHAILEEYHCTDQKSVSPDKTYYLFCFSAKNDNSLRSYLIKFKDFLLKDEDSTLEQISYSLCNRKDHYDKRIAVVANSRIALLKQLDEQIGKANYSVTKYDNIWFFYNEILQVDEEFTEILKNAFPNFKTTYADWMKQLSVADKIQCQSIAFCISVTKLFQLLGIEVNQMMGLGLGKTVVASLSKNLTATEVSKMVTSKDEENPSPPNWEKFVEKKLSEKQSIICEVGGEKTAALELKKHKREHTLFEVLRPFEKPSLATFYLFVSKLYEAGFELSFEPLFTTKQRPAPLPTYSFERKSCWLSNLEDQEARNWLYEPVWEVLDIPVEVPEDQNVLDVSFYAVDYKVAATFAKHLGLESYIPAKEDECEGDKFHSFAGLDKSQFKKDLFKVSDSAQKKTHIVCLTQGDTDLPENRLNEGLYPLFKLSQNLIEVGPINHRLIVVTDSAFYIDQSEKSINSFATSITGFLSGLIREEKKLDVRCIDINLAESKTPKLFPSILNVKTDYWLLGVRRTKLFKRVARKAKKGKAMSIRSSANYLLIGGSNGIGLEVLKYLALSRASIVVIGKRRLPHKLFWEHVSKVSHPDDFNTIHTFSQVEQQGVTVHYYSADVSSAKAMRRIIEKVTRQIGDIHGVINAAGVGSLLRINRHTLSSFKEVLYPKIHGSCNLHALLRNEPLDFFISFSSINALQSSERGSDYAAANAFLDGFTAKLNLDGIAASTIRWGFWSETGMGARMGFKEQYQISDQESFLNKEGIEVFNLIMHLGLRDVIVSKQIIEGIDIDSVKVRTNTERGKEVSNRPGIRNSHEDIEKVITSIWMTVLTRQEIHPDDNFYKLGGHSLLGLQVRNQIEKKLLVRLEYKDIIEYPTIAQLTSRVKDLIGDANLTSEQGSHIPKAPKLDLYPLSEAQKGLWMASEAEQNKSVYNVSTAFKLKIEIDIDAVEKAIRNLLEQHDILRTKFLIKDDQLYQKIEKSESIVTPLEVLELPHVDAFNKLKHHVFDLTNAPLFKIWVVNISDEGNYIFIAMHHLIIDGWSFHIFLKQFVQNYQVCVKGEVPIRSENKIQYVDYAFWEQNQLAIHGEKLSGFWSKYLENLPDSLNLPMDFERRKNRSGAGGVFRFVLNHEHLAGINRLAETNGVSKYLVTMSMLQLLLYRYTGKEDFFIGTPMSLRHHADFEEQIGYFVNILPLRCKLSTEDSYFTLLERNHKLLKEVQEHQSYPFPKILKEAKIKREGNRHPLFDVVFSYEKVQAEVDQNVKFESVGFGAIPSKYDLEITLKDDGKTLGATIYYDSDLFAESSIQQIAKHYTNLINILTLNTKLNAISLDNASSNLDGNIQDKRDLDFSFK